jgi:hypothetical protein
LRFSGLILEKYFNGVFWLLMQRNGQNAIKKTDGKRRHEKSVFSQLFRPKVFDMDSPPPQKINFEIFLWRFFCGSQQGEFKNTQKIFWGGVHVKKKKKYRYLFRNTIPLFAIPFSGHLHMPSAICHCQLPDTRRVQCSIFSPLGPWS